METFNKNEAESIKRVIEQARATMRYIRRVSGQDESDHADPALVAELVDELEKLERSVARTRKFVESWKDDLEIMDAASNKGPIDALLAVRNSGLTNMMAKTEVGKLAGALGFQAAGDWILTATLADYMEALMELGRVVRKVEKGGDVD